MIRLDEVSVVHPVDRRRVVLDDISISIPSDRRVCILGAPKSGKSTLLRVLCGLQSPNRGRVRSTASISFPVGASIGLTPAHSLRRNISFAAKVYRIDPALTIKLVADAAGIRENLDEPFKTVPIEVATRFKYALALCLPFSTYVFDASPNSSITNGPRLQALFDVRRQTRGMILCTGNESLAEQYCDVIYFLRDGRLYLQHDKVVAVSAFRHKRQAQARAGVKVSRASAVIVREARAYLRLGDLAAAEQRIVDLEAEAGEVSHVTLLRADLAIARNDPDLALALLKQACDQNPDAVEPWMALQKLLTSGPTGDDASAWTDRMLAHANVRIRILGVRLRSTDGDSVAVLEAWKRVVDGERACTTGLAEAAQYQFTVGSYDEVVRTAEVALAIEPSSWVMLLWKAKAQRALKQYPDLARTIARLVELKPEVALQFLLLLRKLGFDVAVEPPTPSGGDPDTHAPDRAHTRSMHDGQAV